MLKGVRDRQMYPFSFSSTALLVPCSSCTRAATMFSFLLGARTLE